MKSHSSSWMLFCPENYQWRYLFFQNFEFLIFLGNATYTLNENVNMHLIVLYAMLMQVEQNMPKLRCNTCKISLNAKYSSPMLTQYIALNVSLYRYEKKGSCKSTHQKKPKFKEIKTKRKEKEHWVTSQTGLLLCC